MGTTTWLSPFKVQRGRLPNETIFSATTWDVRPSAEERRALDDLESTLKSDGAVVLARRTGDGGMHLTVEGEMEDYMRRGYAPLWSRARGRLDQLADAESALPERASAHAGGIVLGVAGLAVLGVAGYYAMRGGSTTPSPKSAPAPAPTPSRAPAPSPRPSAPVTARPLPSAPAPHAAAPAPAPAAPPPPADPGAAYASAATVPLTSAPQGPSGFAVQPATDDVAASAGSVFAGAVADVKSAGGPGYHLGLGHDQVFSVAAPAGAGRPWDGQSFTLFADGLWECATCAPVPAAVAPPSCMFSVEHGGQRYDVYTDGTWQAVIHLGS